MNPSTYDQIFNRVMNGIFMFIPPHQVQEGQLVFYTLAVNPRTHPGLFSSSSNERNLALTRTSKEIVDKIEGEPT